MRRRYLPYLIGSALAVLLSGAVLAQVSPSYDLWWSALTGGGGSRQSSNYLVQDALGQWVGGSASSASYQAQAGIMFGAQQGTPTPTFTPSPTTTGTPPATNTPTASPTASKTPTVTPTPTATSTSTATATVTVTAGPPGDEFEDDNTCTTANGIVTDGSPQTHNFHIPGDQDWIKFYALANTTYVIQTSNPGVDSDPVLLLFESCSGGSLGGDDGAFGQTVKLEWDVSGESRWFYVKLQQFDPSISGPTTSYDISVKNDVTPPLAPRNPRCGSLNQTTLGVQWQQNSERDVVRYVVNWRDQNLTEGGATDVDGAETTYTELTGLTPGKIYYMKIQAQDFSGNTSSMSSEVFCQAQDKPDSTAPTITLEQPTTGTSYTTSAGILTFSGIAQDAGSNLSRVKVANTTNGDFGWDYSLSGGLDTFHVEGISLVQGVSNSIQITAYDVVGNNSTKNVTVTRTGGSLGAVIIVGGHNETFSLQSNIDNMTNRAYRVFQGAGYDKDHIYYLANASQDADGDGTNDVDAIANAANLDSAIRTWAVPYVGSGKPLHIYLADHGEIEGFCVSGCSSGQIDPDDLDAALDDLETNTGVNQVNIMMEACHSGSFIDLLGGVGSVSEANRVVISSTGRDNNAYASATGGYFTDAFLSCIASSGSLKACYDQAKAAVALTGVNQTPWLDDNGDGVSNTSDGTIASGRYVASSFGASPPEITSSTVTVEGVNGTLEAQVKEGGDLIDVVWAAVYPPSFQEPTYTTLNLGVPSLRLDPVNGTPGLYRASYPNGFTEQGDYRVVMYAQDKAGMQAQPKLAGQGEDQQKVYLPLVIRG